MRRLRRPDPAVQLLRAVIITLVGAYASYQFAYTPVVVKLFGLDQTAMHRLAEARAKAEKEPTKPKPAAVIAATPAVPAKTPATTNAVAVASAQPHPATPIPVAAAAPQPSTPPKAAPTPPPAPKPPVVATVTPPPAKPEPPKTPPAPAPVKPPTPTPTPTVAVTPPPPAPPKEPVKPAFQPPTFPTMEEITKNWTEIPANLLSQNYRVTLSKELSLKAAAGSILVQPGNTAVLVGQRGNKLLLAPAEGAAAGGEIAIDDTNLKSMLTEIYDSWKIAQIQKAKLAFETAQNSPPPVREEFGVPKSAPVRNDKPARNSDGTYPILLESMKQGHVREITPLNIKKWGEAQKEMIDGKPYWTVIVSYTTKTMFGNFDVDAQARIYGGKVERWIYTGSGETVP